MIKLFRSEGKKFYFTVEDDGNVITTSKNFTRRDTALKGMFAQADASFVATGCTLPKVAVIEFMDMTKGGIVTQYMRGEEV